MMHSPTHELRLGTKLRALREEQQMTLEEVAQGAHLSPDELQRYETDESEPPIGELANLAAALGVSIDHFFQQSIPERRVEVVRASERWTVEPQSDAARASNYRYQALSYRLTEKLMAPFLVEIPPNENADIPTSKHVGEEFSLVLAGQLEIRIGEEVHRLGPGDAIYFDSQLEHSFRAVEGTSVRLVACIAQARRKRPDSDLNRSYD